MSNYNWYAIYTNPRSEKKANILLQEKNIITYLPLVKRLKQWSDRKKFVEEPLIRSYLFVNISEKEYFEVLNTQHVSRFITFEGKAVPIPEDQIEIVKRLLSTDLEVDVTSENLAEGDTIRVARGPLIGMVGQLIKYKQRKRVMVKLEQIGKTLIVNLPLAFLEPAPQDI
ncbi:MAG: UpxY family transcription antiterminator [Cyclobacteriaceae bacterium]